MCCGWGVQVPYELAARFAQSNGLFFSEASAVSSLNVKLVFEHLLQEIYNQREHDRVADATSSTLSAREGGVQLANHPHYATPQQQQAGCCRG